MPSLLAPPPLLCSLRPASPMPSTTPSHVAVIGAGAAGLAAARELRREGLRVVVFERSASVGGTWVYTPEVESDPLGLDPSRRIVHTSLYDSLRTNLPRECMGFRDFPFAAAADGAGDTRRFPGHPEVLRYLEGFAREFGLEDVVRFETDVVEVERGGDGRWRVRFRRKGEGDETEVYDGVVVCNGHYTEPRIAEIPGIDAWPGKEIHSHNYRVPELYLNQVVVLIGSSASAVDISRDIANYAKEVHIVSRSESLATPARLPGYDNMWLHSMIDRTKEDGTILFLDGTSLVCDVILHCTGYKYHFPFLRTDGMVKVDDNCVGPLFKHVFPPLLAPQLAFIGLPWKVIPFPLFELQSKWVACVLSGRVALPTSEEMLSDVEVFYKEIYSKGYPKRYTHNLSEYQFDYDDWLAEQCGIPAVEEWRKQMYEAARVNRVARPETYRDIWDDDHLVLEAQQDFVTLHESSTGTK